MSDSTIFFAHRGPLKTYLWAAILQAKVSSPNSHLVLLGDQPRSSLPPGLEENLDYANLKDYSESAEVFSRVFRPDGPNSFDYELMNFQRWFFVESFSSKHSLHGPLLLLDSDSFLYLPVETVVRHLRTGMSVVDAVGPQFTFFLDRRNLETFTGFLLKCFEDARTYQNVQAFVREKNEVGLPNVGDMAALGFYAKSNSLEDLGKSTRSDFVFCENIGSSQDLAMNLLGKKISWRRGRRYFTTRDGRRVLAGGVHLQGGNKVLWPFFVDTTVRGKMRKLSPLDYRIARREALEKAVRIGLLKSAARLRKLVSGNRAR